MPPAKIHPVEVSCDIASYNTTHDHISLYKSRPPTQKEWDQVIATLETLHRTGRILLIHRSDFDDNTFLLASIEEQVVFQTEVEV